MENTNNKKGKKKVSVITVKPNKKGRHIIPILNVLRVIIIPLYYLVKPFRFYGNKKIKDGSAVLVCNHYTFLDAVYPAATTWEALHYISKKENFSVPILSFFMRKVKAISANRDGNDVRVLLDSIKCLKNGEKIVIFPEGTRNKAGGEEMLPFHHGAAVMAIKTKAPIIPMVIYKKPKFFRVAHIVIGAPMELTEYYDRKLTEREFIEADDKIRARMLELRQQHSEFLANKKKKAKKA